MSIPRPSANFQDDLRVGLVRLVKAAGFAASIDEDSVEDACYRYFNLRHCRIPRRPREVLWSRVLRGRSLAPPALAALQAIEKASLDGGDLTGWQSANVRKKPMYDDRLLIDWGVHHLHLSINQSGTARDGGAEELVFVYVTADRLLFIDVKPHPGDVPYDKQTLHERIDELEASGMTREAAMNKIAVEIEPGWSEHELLEILDDDWPDAIAHMRPHGFGDADNVTPTAGWRQVMRIIGLNTLTVLSNGHSYISASGFMSDGSNQSVRVATDSLRSAVQDLQVRCQDRAAVIAAAITAAGKVRPRKMKLAMNVRQDPSGTLLLSVSERTTGFAVPRRMLYDE